MVCSAVSCPKEDPIVPVTDITISPESVKLAVGETVQLTVTMAPDNATDQEIEWSASNASIATVEDGFVTAIASGVTTITAKVGEASAICEVMVFAQCDAVDLGLSVQWSSCNLGANVPEEFGDYYAWGETKTKQSFSWQNYKWCLDGKITKYMYYEESGLEGVDDAAYALLGNHWRMPTAKECNELIDYCKWESAEVNGVTGWRVSSMFEGFTDKSIFIPNAGYKDGSTTRFSTEGFYWIKEFTFLVPECALSLRMSVDDFPPVYVDYAEMSLRYYGYPIRPVRKVADNWTPGRIPVSMVHMSETQLYLHVGEHITIGAQVDPSVATNNIITWKSSNEGIVTVEDGYLTALAEGDVVITATADGKEATCHVIVDKADTPLTIEVPDAVDLGLSVRWANMNVGAKVPEDVGAYFSWGETSPKNDYGFYSYAWICDRGMYYSKYCHEHDDCSVIPDMKGRIDMSDDAAHVYYGDKWRMPTRSECLELINNCDVTKDIRNGVAGRTITSRVNGNSIFVPEPGYMDRNTLSNDYFYFWSSSLGLQDEVALGVYSHPQFRRNASSMLVQLEELKRFYGLPIRPVIGEYNPVTIISLNREEDYLRVGTSVLISATVFPLDATEPFLYWKSDKPSVATVTAVHDLYDTGLECLVRTNEPGKATVTAYSADGNCSSSFIIEVYGEGYNTPKMVDMGLSVMWSSCNLGAEWENEFGGYWAWGRKTRKNIIRRIIMSVQRITTLHIYCWAGIGILQLGHVDKK